MTNTVLGSLAHVIGTIGKRDFYPAVTEYLHRCLNYDNVIVIVFSGAAVPAVLYKKIYGPDVFRYLAEQYLPAAYLLDPIYHFHLRRGEPGLYRLLDVAPDQFRRSRYFKWYYGRIGITDEISVVLPIGESATITISMGKDGSSGQVFSQKVEECLRSHEPVIMSLLRAHWVASEAPPAIEARSMSITDGLIAAMRRHHGVLLSKRQAEVALLILQGHSSPSIGLHLGVSPQTVKVFRKQLYNKCSLSSQAELFALMMPILERATS
ncbi:helix-turn-helix transcriptional regulator [Mesorhizobium sp. YC-39]|uniref:helix-turn-helix transcriptional regulator n=1 Tax=unclassified Mesorhizobium TaxID=325217 RepID=UPI0021E98C15|nr:MULTISPECIES: helix-turn-helix transcriptional regulator [unclassified Mesorhizobium]MCV3205141.1 helix-turn-helix transcriptional regulator [Mesorhizobium sp. YC-2]MCV3228460.1 helix-turn-helix transcriptional regulator [Mesorhizobium sp. YC-39]